MLNFPHKDPCYIYITHINDLYCPNLYHVHSMIYQSFGSMELEKILKSDALQYMKLQTSRFIGKRGLHVLFHMAFNAAAVRPSLVSRYTSGYSANTRAWA